MCNESTVYVGCPGSGKTQTLIDKCKELVKNKVGALRDIGFFTFSKSASIEAKIRIKAAYPAMLETSFPWFRTLHSFGRIVCGIPTECIMQPWHYENFFREHNIDYDENNAINFSFPEWDLTNLASAFVHHDSIRRNRLLNIDDYVSSLPVIDPAAERLNEFTAFYTQYKQNNRLFDFNDLIENAVKAQRLPEFEHLILDEAQDLTSLQWALMDRLVEGSREVFVAGDDRQAIYTFAGADINRFIKFPGKEMILDQSYRCPKQVQIHASVIESRLSVSRSPLFKPTTEEGEAVTVFNLEDVPIRINEQWMFLARSKFHLLAIRKSINSRIEGIVDVNKKEMAKKNISFSTIHRSKGREADNVVVFLGITQRIVDSYSFFKNSFDNELRIFYVGFTRARKRLYLYDTTRALRFPF